MGTRHSYNILFFYQDILLLTSTEEGDIENLTLALTLGANINVHHPYRVSTLIK